METFLKIKLFIVPKPLNRLKRNRMNGKGYFDLTIRFNLDNKLILIFFSSSKTGLLARIIYIWIEIPSGTRTQRYLHINARAHVESPSLHCRVDAQGGARVPLCTRHSWVNIAIEGEGRKRERGKMCARGITAVYLSQWNITALCQKSWWHAHRPQERRDAVSNARIIPQTWTRREFPQEDNYRASLEDSCEQFYAAWVLLILRSRLIIKSFFFFFFLTYD